MDPSEVAWRDTMRPVRFYMIDARLLTLLTVWLFVPNWWTTAAVLLAMAAFRIAEARGYRFRAGPGSGRVGPQARASATRFTPRGCGALWILADGGGVDAHAVRGFGRVPLYRPTSRAGGRHCARRRRRSRPGASGALKPATRSGTYWSAGARAPGSRCCFSPTAVTACIAARNSMAPSSTPSRRCFSRFPICRTRPRANSASGGRSLAVTHRVPQTPPTGGKP